MKLKVLLLIWGSFSVFSVAAPAVEQVSDSTCLKEDEGNAQSDCVAPLFNKRSWSQERSSRRLKMQVYKLKNRKGFEAMTTGSNGYGQVPEVLFRVFPNLFPEIWGSPEDNFLTPGLNINPVAKKKFIPLGMATAPEEVVLANSQKKNMNMVGFNCLACHATQVRVENKLRYIYAGANPRIDNLFFMMAKTFSHEKFNLAEFRNALSQIPAKEIGDRSNQIDEDSYNFFMKDDAGAQELIAKYKASGQSIIGAFHTYLKPSIYNSLNAPQPLAQKRGSHDALLATYTAFIGAASQAASAQAPAKAAELKAEIEKNMAADPTYLQAELEQEKVATNNPNLTMEQFIPTYITKKVTEFVKGEFVKSLQVTLPKSAAEVDPPSMWMQKGRGKVSHWDGGLPEVFHRNIGAASASFNKPTNMKTVELVTDFLQEFPPEPYPFEVDIVKASRGRRHFQNYCLKCHETKVQIHDINDVKTDAERFKHMNPYSRDFLGKLLINLCSPANAYNGYVSDRCYKDAQNKVPFAPQDLVIGTKGYQSDDLSGLWARAPYLHNGSVPTLYQLLVPSERATTFYRGSFLYDEKQVGFNWKDSRGDYASRPVVGTVLYNTSLQGNGNVGHDDLQHLGLDWKKNPLKLKELLEYLKTL